MKPPADSDVAVIKAQWAMMTSYEMHHDETEELFSPIYGLIPLIDSHTEYMPGFSPYLFKAPELIERDVVGISRLLDQEPELIDRALPEEEERDYPTLLSREPELLEDPWLEDRCLDSVLPWCDPEHEDTSLAYLKELNPISLQAFHSSHFTSPVDEGLLIRGMKEPAKKRQRGHYGLDIIPRSWRAGGIPIRAVEDGIVITASKARGYGYYTLIYHQNGLFSLYSHTLKKNRVQTGQEVNRGDQIAFMGKSGNAKGYHLHFELIDLKDIWPFEESVDEFIRSIQRGEKSAHERNRFDELVFSKQAKKDPLPYLSNLTAAKRVNGKWVVDEPVISAQAKTSADQ